MDNNSDILRKLSYESRFNLAERETMRKIATEHAKLQTDNKRLRRVLIIYGMHLDDCPCYVHSGPWDANDHHTATEDELNIDKTKDGGFLVITMKCTCGFEQASKE